MASSKQQDATPEVAKKPTAAEIKAQERAQKAKEANEAKLAKQIAADREAKMSGNDLRAKYNDQLGYELTGPRRIKLLRRHGFGGLVKASYDRDEAAKAREAAAAERERAAHKPAKAKA
jgi:hypothetical protein